MNKFKQYKSIPFEVKGLNQEKREVEGYISKFMNVDAVGDRVFPGAFDKSLKENGPLGLNRIPLCAQHDTKKPIGKFLDLRPDSQGLYFKAFIGTHTDGEDYYKMFKEGIIKEFSIGYVNVKTEPNEYQGLDIKELKLFEGSAVTIACNEQATLESVKSDTPAEMAVKALEEFDCMIDILAKKGVTEDNKLTLESKAYDLKSLYSNLLAATPAEEKSSQEPIQTEEEKQSGLLKELHKQFLT